MTESPPVTAVDDHSFDHRSFREAGHSRSSPHKFISTSRRAFDEALTPQLTQKAKTSVGVDFCRESIFITTIVPDEDGILKLKRIEGFTDSKAQLDFAEAVAEAKANRQFSA